MICIDELGPIAVKTYPGEVWQSGLNRATFEPDYGRRGKVWVHGAFEPATGQAEIVISPRRDTASHLQLIEKVIEKFPCERWLLIEDNLSTHHSRDVKTAFLAWPEVQVQFIPKYACWLNLIEPWWKQLRSLALKGRRFERLMNSRMRSTVRCVGGMHTSTRMSGRRCRNNNRDTSYLWDKYRKYNSTTYRVNH